MISLLANKLQTQPVLAFGFGSLKEDAGFSKGNQGGRLEM
jgi:hypothetical protein